MPKFSNKVDGRPAMQFYPDDWLSEPSLRAAPPEVRGIWADVLCFCWRSPERGVLLMPNGCPPDAREMARLLGITVEDWTRISRYIIEKEIGSKRKSDGALYNRRMVRESVKEESKSEHGRTAANKRWGAQGMPKVPPSTPAPPPTPPSPPAPARKDLELGRDGQEPTRPDKSSPASPTDPKADENAKAVKVRNWFAACYKTVNKSDLPGFDPADRRMSVQDRNACKAIYAMYGNGREGKPGYVSPAELRRRLYHALAGNYYKVRAPANVAEFKRILPNCVDAALRPTDQRKSIPNVPDRPKVNETPGAERKRYADPDPWEEIPE